MDTSKFLKDLKNREAQAGSRNDYQKSNIPFMKLGEGKHRLRFLPKGNKEENLPYKVVELHAMMVSNGGSKFVQYILCYDWLFSHDNAVEYTIKPLMKMKKLTQSDVNAFKEAGGCPICRAHQVLKMGGEDKDTYNSCRSRIMSYWNVLNRADKKIYVASLSDAKYKEVCSAIASGLDIDEETGKPGPDAEDILDINTGFDFQCVASGNNMGRRYAYSVIAKKKPVTSEDIAEGEKPINLMLAVAETFKSYGDMCTALRSVHGILLESYGFKYGIALKEDEKKRIDLDIEEEEDEPKKSSNDLKSKVNPLTGNKITKAPWEEDEETEEEESEPVKKLEKKLTGQKQQKPSTILDDDEEEEVEISNGKLIVNGVELY